VEAIASPTNDSKVVFKFMKKNIFTQFGTPRPLLSDNGTHFCNKSLEPLLKKYRIFHKIATPYLPKQVGRWKTGIENWKAFWKKRWIGPARIGP